MGGWLQRWVWVSPTASNRQDEGLTTLLFRNLIVAHHVLHLLVNESQVSSMILQFHIPMRIQIQKIAMMRKDPIFVLTFHIPAGTSSYLTGADFLWSYQALLGLYLSAPRLRSFGSFRTSMARSSIFAPPSFKGQVSEYSNTNTIIIWYITAQEDSETCCLKCKWLLLAVVHIVLHIIHVHVVLVDKTSSRSLVLWLRHI